MRDTMTDPALSLSVLADVGGTNTRVALCEGGQVQGHTIRRYANAGFDDLNAVLARYLGEVNAGELDQACVAVAGPVRDGKARLTNLDWTIREADLTAELGVSRASVINDLQAQGHALPYLEQGRVSPVIANAPVPPATNATRLVVGVGTGFNSAPVHDTGSGTFVAVSESGHMRLPCCDADGHSVGRSVSGDDGFCAVEDVLSGRGMENVYRALSGASTRSASEIVARFEEGSDPMAKQSIDLFARTLGHVCGDLALVHLPFGGIYLVGGVARAIGPHLGRSGFAEAFAAKGRFARFMDSFSVHIVEDDYAALTGCAAHLGLISKGQTEPVFA